LLEHKNLKGKIVQSISMGALGERIAQAYQLPYEEVPVGFKHIADRILRESIVAGGEESGGFAFSNTLPERDGILNGLMFLEMILVTQKKPSQLVRDLFKKFGQVYFDRKDYPLETPVESKDAFVAQILSQLPGQILGRSVKTTRTYDGIKIVLEDESWLLLRPSGTEPLLRVYAESDSRQRTQKLLEAGKSLVMQSNMATVSGEIS
jgi:phosphomannomutase